MGKTTLALEVSVRRQKINEEVGGRIRLWRRVRGLTTVELGEKTQIRSDSTISKMEKGDLRITVAMLAEACVALGVTPNELVFGNKEGTPSGAAVELDHR